MSKFSETAGLLALGLLAVAGSVAEAETSSRMEREKIGELSIPSYKVGQLRNSRIVVNGRGDVSYVDRSSWIQSEWPLHFATFRAFSAKKFDRIEVNGDGLTEGAVVQCQYRTANGNWKSGYVGIHLTR